MAKKEGPVRFGLKLKVEGGVRRFEGSQRAVFTAMKDDGFTRLDECLRRGDKIQDGQVGAYLNLPLVLSGPVSASDGLRPDGDD